MISKEKFVKYMTAIKCASEKDDKFDAAIRELNKTKSGELWDRIDEFPEEERDGRSDLQILADELSYLIDNYNESGHCMHDDLEEAKEILKETQNGKVIPLIKSTLQPIYDKSRIVSCFNVVEEYKNLLALKKRIHAKGLRGYWE